MVSARDNKKEIHTRTYQYGFILTELYIFVANNYPNK